MNKMQNMGFYSAWKGSEGDNRVTQLRGCKI